MLDSVSLFGNPYCHYLLLYLDKHFKEQAISLLLLRLQYLVILPKTLNLLLGSELSSRKETHVLRN